MIRISLEYLHTFSHPNKIQDYQRFFKTAQGEYGYGDLFLGICVPDTRKAVKKYYNDLSLTDILTALSSSYHEERLFALLCLVYKFNDKKSTQNDKKDIFTLYISNTKYINNWDLVDTSAPQIVGGYLFDKNRDILYDFANSENLWEKRIAIIATLYFIKNRDYTDTLQISKILLDDTHDLIHKAVGWMLREIGKMDFQTEFDFLKIHYKQMPRTMLRYAIEQFSEPLRQDILKDRLIC